MQATQQGVILGTAAYMSPEQAKGLPADKRADVFAFGCVLYEMLTGRQTFDGQLATEILASVIRAEPDYTTLQVNLHPEIKKVLRRCLEKDPMNRFRDVGDVRFEIEQVLADPSGLLVQPVSEVVQAKRQSKLPWVAAFVLGALVAAGASFWILVQPLPSQPVWRFPLTLPATQSLPSGAGTLVAISPDGQTLIYRGLEDGVVRLYRRDLDRLDTTPILGTEGAGETPFFSADGQWLAFRTGTTLMKVALAGGRPVRISELPAGGLRGGSWTPDDVIITGSRIAGLARVPAGGGEPVIIATPDDGRQYWYPQVLPGNQTVLFTPSHQQADAGDVMLLDIKSGDQRVLVQDGVAGHYVPTGHLVFVREGDIWATGFDLDRLEVVGDPVVIEQGVRVEPGGAVQMAVAAEGSLVYVTGAEAGGQQRTLVWVDREGNEEAIGLEPGAYYWPRLSPDGTRLTVSIESDAEGEDVWVSDLTRDPPTLTNVTVDPSLDNVPLWTSTANILCSHPIEKGDSSGFSQKVPTGLVRWISSSRVKHLVSLCLTVGPRTARLWPLATWVHRQRDPTSECCRWRATATGDPYLKQKPTSSLPRSLPRGSGSPMSLNRAVSVRSTLNASLIWGTACRFRPMARNIPCGQKTETSYSFVGVAMVQQWWSLWRPVRHSFQARPKC